MSPMDDSLRILRLREESLPRNRSADCRREIGNSVLYQVPEKTAVTNRMLRHCLKAYERRKQRLISWKQTNKQIKHHMGVVVYTFKSSIQEAEAGPIL